MSTVAVVTPTRNRSQAISLLARWLRQQTRQPDRWIVIDDGDEDIKKEPPMTHLFKRQRSFTEGKISLCLNLRAAIPFMSSDFVFICEDDEYYAPTYLETMLSHFEEWPPQMPYKLAVGIGYSKYYHLGLKSYYVHENMAHASLAQTAFHKNALMDFAAALDDPNERFVDIKFWKRVRDRSVIWRDGNSADGKAGAQYVGIKGMPGLPGIGFGHKAMPQYIHDEDLSMLRQWIRLQDFLEYDRIGRGQLWTSRKD